MVVEEEQKIRHSNFGDKSWVFVGGSEKQRRVVRIGRRAQLVLAPFCWHLISVTEVINWIIRRRNRARCRWWSSLSTQRCWVCTEVNPAPARDREVTPTPRPRAGLGLEPEPGMWNGQLLHLVRALPLGTVRTLGNTVFGKKSLF